MPKKYQQLIDKAIIIGAITPEQYLQIPWNERENMQYFFSFKMQWVLTSGITFEQYMQLLLNYRKITQDINSMTFEQFLELRWYEHSSMSCFFSPDGQRAVAEGIITLEQYLQIPWDERDSLQYLFSYDGRQAIAEGIITLEQYLKIPVFRLVTDPIDEQRDEILCRLPPYERQAVKKGIITLEQCAYLRIPLLEFNKQSVLLQLRWNDRISMQYLFSPDGRRAVADGIITLEQYLQIPWSDREDVIIALQDHDTRQRIINGNITIENIIGIGPTHDVATHPINSIQNTSPESVHQSVSESSTQLLNFYESGSEAQQEDIINQQILTRERDILLIQLKLLENKAGILRDRNHLLAYCKAANIVILLRDLAHDYFTEHKIDYKTYKEKSLDIINEERPELDKHRGYKKILGNLLILICTLGTGQLINKACTGNFLFFKKTDSSKQIDKINEAIKKMEFALIT